MALEHRISELDTYLFAKGTHYEIYEKIVDCFSLSSLYFAISLCA